MKPITTVLLVLLTSLAAMAQQFSETPDGVFQYLSRKTGVTSPYSTTSWTATKLGAKVDVAAYNTFRATQAATDAAQNTDIGNRLLSSKFDSYTGAQAITNAAKLEASSFLTYTGSQSTIDGNQNADIGSRLPTTAFNSYTGTQATTNASKLNTSDFASYTGTQAGTDNSQNTQIGTRLPTTAFNSYTGTQATTDANQNTDIGSRLLSSVFTSYTGTQATTNASKLNTSDFASYTGTQAGTDAAQTTQIGNRLLTSQFASYTGTQASTDAAQNADIGNRLLSSIFNSYTGTQATTNAGKLNTSDFSSYSTTNNNRVAALESQVSSMSGNSGGVSTTAFNSYTGNQASTDAAQNTDIGSRLLSSVFSSYTGTQTSTDNSQNTQIGSRVTTTAFNSYTGNQATTDGNQNTDIGSRLPTTAFSSYTGTQASTDASQNSSLAGKANLTGGNTFNGNQVMNNDVTMNGQVNYNLTQGVSSSAGTGTGYTQTTTSTLQDASAATRIFRISATTAGTAGGAETQLLETNSFNAQTGGTLGVQSGVNVNIRVNNAGTTGAGYGFRTIPILTNTGNMNTWYGFMARTPTITGAGIITNSYGVYVDPQKQTNVTNAYAFYQQGSNDLNLFAGNTILGATSTTYNNAKLQIEAVTNVGNNGVAIGQAGTGRGLYVNRNVATALRPMVSFVQNNASAGQPTVEIQQSDLSQAALTINNNGTTPVFSVSGNGGASAASLSVSGTTNLAGPVIAPAVSESINAANLATSNKVDALTTRFGSYTSTQTATDAAQNTDIGNRLLISTFSTYTNTQATTNAAKLNVSDFTSYSTTNNNRVTALESQVSSMSGNSGSSGATLYFDWVTPASAADLNTAIANCTKPVLYVLGTSLNISETVIINNKSNLKIVAFGLELVLTQWNSGTQGIMLDYRGTLKNIVIDGFRFNCSLPSSAGDGGGYAIMAARGNVCPMLDGLIVQNCYFTSPTLHENAISLNCVGWGGYGIRKNVLIRNCNGENIKRFFFECHNQEAPFNTTGTARYFNIRLENCVGRNLGNNGISSDGGMMVSFDGPGDNNEVVSCRAYNVYFAAYEAVGTSNVRFINNTADYDAGYTTDFVGYSFTDGNHGSNFGPINITVSGGHVRCTGRGYNLTEAKSCTFYDVTFISRSGNTLVRAHNNVFSKCFFKGISTKQYLTSLDAANNNEFTDGFMGNQGAVDDNTGGRCTIVLDHGASNNKFYFLRHYQEPRTNGDGPYYENTILDFSGNSTNQKIGNQSNNPNPGF